MNSPMTMRVGDPGSCSCDVDDAEDKLHVAMRCRRRRRRQEPLLDEDLDMPAARTSPLHFMARPMMTLVCFCAIVSVAFGWSPSPSNGLVQRLTPSPSATIHLYLNSHSHPCTRIKSSSSTQIMSSTSSASSRGTKEESNTSPLPPIVNELTDLTELLIQYLHEGSNDNYEAISSQPINVLKGMMSLYTTWISTDKPSSRQKFQASAVIDKAFRLVTNDAFSSPYRLGWVNLGLEALQLQLRPNNLNSKDQLLTVNGDGDKSSINGDASNTELVSLHPAYATIPKGTWLKALRALTSKDINSRRSSSTRAVKSISPDVDMQWITPSNAAFRILQRLVSGRGVRIFRKKKLGSEEEPQLPKLSLDERDFNMVLHSYAAIPHNAQLHAAHRVMALQERTPHAPPLSPVAYSILLKAYGQVKDVKNVEMSILHAQRNGVIPDIVMANTVLDAYVECGMLDRAQDVLRDMTSDGEDEGYWPLLRPNSRTYNTLLKGMAEEGDIRGALKLSKVVRTRGLWDDITTNTLVKAAVTAQDFPMAENILSNHTSVQASEQNTRGRRRDHPNIEAYTELLDGYAKDSQLENALRVMQLMQKRGVTPNEYTYTCMVGALAKNTKVRQARKMLNYAAGLPQYNGRWRTKLTPTYNAFISGLLSGSENAESDGQQFSHAANIVEVLAVLQEMRECNIQPNVVTVTLVVDGLGKCNPPRVKEATELVQLIEFTSLKQTNGYYNRQGMVNGKGVSLSNNKIATALIQAYGRTDDVESAVQSFDRILPQPDVVAFNALLDACCRNERLKLALELFKKHASFKLWNERQEQSSNTSINSSSGSILRDGKWDVLIKPDVVTYTSLISALLQLKSRAATKRAAEFYEEMKNKWWISPDTVLVDTILTAMIADGPIGFEESDIKFTLLVLKDGARLDWKHRGQYENRKRAVRSILVGCSSKMWKNDEYAYGLVSEGEPEDPLFTKKGWNRIDSGFQLWGGVEGNDDYDWQQQEDERDDASVDSFLASKGWNDIDSGFRLL